MLHPNPDWRIPTPGPAGSAAARLLAAELGAPTVLANLLVARGIHTPETAHAFLHPSLEHLHPPALLLGLDRALARLRQALLAREPILIYGDYDVDGTVATVLLKTACERAAASLGIPADIRFHIPHRIREGYGIQDRRLEQAAAEGIRLVISVDTGIRAFTAAAEARRLGLDLIVTDHHLPDAAAGVPDALAVLNPNQPGCPYPCKELCGAAVSFKLAQALLESTAPDAASLDRLRQKTLPSFLKLLAIATVADAVPLTGENRVIAALGLRELRNPAQPGLRALMDLAQIDPGRPVSAFDIGFRLAPRINAAGRMDIASDVVDMFLTRDAAQATALAQKLHQLNDDRRATEAEALTAIEARLEAMATQPGGLAPCLVLDDPAWHRGVIGILASRVVDRTGRPALVLAHEPDGQAYGSGRSVAGFHLLEALEAAHAAAPETPLFTRFGGHAHAVGFSLPSSRVDDLRHRLEVHASLHLDLNATATNLLECDADLPLAAITPDFLDTLERFAPFGQGNDEPLFLARNVRLCAPPRLINDRHLRLSVEDPATGARRSGVAWSRTRRSSNATDWAALALTLTQGCCVDLAFRLRRSWRPGFEGWELEIVAVRHADSSVVPALGSAPLNSSEPLAREPRPIY